MELNKFTLIDNYIIVFSSINKLAFQISYY